MILRGQFVYKGLWDFRALLGVEVLGVGQVIVSSDWDVVI